MDGLTEELQLTISVFIIRKVNQSHYRPDIPGGFQEVKFPRLRDNGPGWL